MNSLMILVGPNADADSYLMDLASVAAGLAVESNRRVLFVGTSQSALAVGTEIIGYQQERTVEGGERFPSPMVLAGLIRNVSDTSDPLYRDPEFSEDTRYDEGGFLSELVDLGIIDLDSGMEERIISRSLEDLDSQLDDFLKREKPSQILIIGSVSSEMLERLSHNAMESNIRLGIIGVDQAPKGAEVLFSEVAEPKLDGTPIRGVGQSEEGGRGETASEPLVEAVKNAVWEAGLSHAVAVWVRGDEIRL
jgi:hypothetical protein